MWRNWMISEDREFVTMLSTISRTGLNGISRVISSSNSTVLAIRHASLNSAIGEGIRRSQTVDRDNRRGNESRFPKRERQYEGQYEGKYRSRQYEKSGESNLKDGQTNGARQQYGRSDQSNSNDRRTYGARQYGEDKYERSGFNSGVQRNYGQREREYGAKKAWTSDGVGRKDYDRRQSPWNDNSHSHDKAEKKRSSSSMRMSSFVLVISEDSLVNINPDSNPDSNREHKIIHSHNRDAEGLQWMNHGRRSQQDLGLTGSRTACQSGAVEAALRCSRRQLYKLYIYQSTEEELSAAKVTIRKLALSKNIAVKMAFAGWDRLMDKMSAGRPHNGCILEASPLPKLPVRGLQAVPSISEEYFRTELAPQTREEAAVNGTDDRIRIHHPSPPPHETEQRHRYPIVLLLDGVVDTGNMGAIIRSSYFLGVDAIVLAGRNSAPLSPITIKCSAGAAENMPILHVKNEVDFIQRSQQNGWRFYAADAPTPGSVHLDHISTDGDQSGAKLPSTTAPSVIMMGSEATGLSSHIKSHADAIISIPGARQSSILGVQSDPARIDSLNVSVAAALLMEKFLRTPMTVGEVLKKEKSTGKNTGKEKMW
ncbi:tRNA/rRNA methyltransferase SpoU [Penicillium expansum]|nr:tRNA/rRNA methyltransferase SpoU [Penicillium expansum]